LSFLGAVADAGEKIARVRLTSGANTISSNGIPGNPFDDVVVMDDFLFLKNSVGGRKSRSCFDRLSTNGIFSDHPTGELPFALSSPRSGRVEGVLVSSIEVSRFMPNRLPSRNRRVWRWPVRACLAVYTGCDVAARRRDASGRARVSPPIPKAMTGSAACRRNAARARAMCTRRRCRRGDPGDQLRRRRQRIGSQVHPNRVR
jgi:hypothetical protein